MVLDGRASAFTQKLDSLAFFAAGGELATRCVSLRQRRKMPVNRLFV
jgi:hypothetical protein